MCKSQAEGGQRCASHARARYVAIAQTPLDRRGPDFASRLDEAAVEYASTPEGRDMFNSRAATFAQQRDLDRELGARHILDRGERLRQANKAAAAAVSAERHRQSDTADPNAPLLNLSGLKAMHNRNSRRFNPSRPEECEHVDEFEGGGRLVRISTTTDGRGTTTRLTCYAGGDRRDVVLAESTATDEESFGAQHRAARAQVDDALDAQHHLARSSVLRQVLVRTLNGHLSHAA